MHLGGLDQRAPPLHLHCQTWKRYLKNNCGSIGKHGRRDEWRRQLVVKGALAHDRIWNCSTLVCSLLVLCRHVARCDDQTFSSCSASFLDETTPAGALTRSESFSFFVLWLRRSYAAQVGLAALWQSVHVQPFPHRIITCVATADPISWLQFDNLNL